MSMQIVSSQVGKRVVEENNLQEAIDGYPVSWNRKGSFSRDR